jgi:hypothetical protein
MREKDWRYVEYMNGRCWRILESTPDITEKQIKWLQTELKQIKEDAYREFPK